MCLYFCVKNCRQLCKNVRQLTRMDLQTIATVWQAGEVGKSIGRLGRPRILISGSNPFWVTNSRQWSSVELLVRIASTNFIYTKEKTHIDVLDIHLYFFLNNFHLKRNKILGTCPLKFKILTTFKT